MSTEGSVRIAIGQKADGDFYGYLPQESLPAIAEPQLAPIDPHVQYRDWIAWGANDNKPTADRLLIQKVSIAGATIRKVVAKLAGNSICYYNPQEIKNGRVEHAYDEEVEDFLLNNRIRTRWLLAQCGDYAYHINMFGTMILSNDRKKIARIVHRSAEHCRVRYNKDLTAPSHVIYSPRFTDGGLVDETSSIAFPILNLDQSDNNRIGKSNAKEFAYHSFFPTPGSFYYGVPWWTALFEKDGWLKVSANVPKIILSMHRNQLNIKYIIYIPESYFVHRHENWKMMDVEAKKKVIDAKINELNAALAGTENVGNTISHVFKESPTDYKAYSKIEIEAIDDKLKKDSWVPDSNASDAQIVQALGEHPSQVGLQPAGGKMGAGSGSDQRESYNTSINLNTPDQDIILEPLNFIARFNGWPYRFFIDHTFHTTTNEQESGLVPGDGSLIIEKPNNS